MTLTLRTILLLNFLAVCLSTYSQKEDYNWITGGGVFLTNTKNVFSFNESGYTQDTVVNPDNLRINQTNTALSDSLGGLLFYSSGVAIYNSNHEIMLNGDSINPGYLRELSVSIPGSYSMLNGMLALQKPENSGRSLLLHTRGDTIVTGNPIIDNNFVAIDLLYSIVQQDDTGVIYCAAKNIPIIQDTLNTFGIASCRHGNGRDWWVIVGESFTNCYYTLLITPDTILQIHKQCLGIKSDFLSSGQSFFSPNGEMFARACDFDGVEIFDFDRCSGLLSNPFLLIDSTEISYNVSCFSPNNQFIYVAIDRTMQQFDLMASDISSSRVEVDSLGSIPFSHGYSTMYNAPDGTIIVASGSRANWSIIHKPNELGLACDFEPAVPILKGGSYALPNFPNFRLGRLIGSDCDTLFNDTVDVVNSIEIENSLELYPNPANSKLRLEYGNFLWSSNDELSIVISNTLGQIMIEEKLSDYGLFKDYNVSKWESGYYWVSIYNRGSFVGVRKLVVE